MIQKIMRSLFIFCSTAVVYHIRMMRKMFQKILYLAWVMIVF